MIKREIYLLRLFFFIFFANWTFIFSFIPVYLRENIGFSIGMIGLLSSFSSLFGAISQVYIGYFSDKLRKRKPFILISLIILILVYYTIFPKIHSLIYFLLLYIVLGICFNSVTTISNVLVIDYSISEKTGISYATTRIWGSIGFLSLMLIISLYPKLTEPNIMFSLISAIYLIGFVVILMVKEPPLKVSIKPLDFRDIKKLILKPHIRNFLLFYVIYYVALLGASSNVNLLIRSLGGTHKDISLAYAASSFSEIPFMLFWGYLSDKIGRRPILIFSSIILPIRIFLYTFTKISRDVILIQFLHSLTFAVIGTIPIVYLNDLVSEEERATAQGLLSMAMAISSTIGPLFSGVIADILGLKGMYVVLGFIAILAMFLALKKVQESKE